MVWAVLDWLVDGFPARSREALRGAVRLGAAAREDVGAIFVCSPNAMPDDPGGLRAALAGCGVRTAAVVAAEGYGPLVPEPVVARLGSLFADTAPRAWVMPGTVDWRTVAARLAARLDLALAGEVVEFGAPGEETADLGPGFVVVREVFGGSLLSREWIAAPAIITVRNKAFACEPDPPAACDPGEVSVKLLGDLTGAAAAESAAGGPGAPPAAELVSVDREGPDVPSLADAAVIVSGGRGIGSAEGFCLLADLARALGGAVGASRAAVDAGWAPYSLQVGQSGRTVSPRLYLAMGISGAAQHLAGMRAAGVVVAVNRDSEAPLLGKCTFGIVADWREFAEALLEELSGDGPAG